jgi:RNase adaptor protein for sRNA GlmZ degradation
MAVSTNELKGAIQQAGDLYYRLVLLAGPQGAGKTGALQAVSKAHGYPIINANLQLCKAMLELTRSQRTRQVERLFKAVVVAASAEVVLLDNLEVLFDPGLEVEPLRLLLNASRNQTLVASWNGTTRTGRSPTPSRGIPSLRSSSRLRLSSSLSTAMANTHKRVVP